MNDVGSSCDVRRVVLLAGLVMGIAFVAAFGFCGAAASVLWLCGLAAAAAADTLLGGLQARGWWLCLADVGCYRIVGTVGILDDPATDGVGSSRDVRRVVLLAVLVMGIAFVAAFGFLRLAADLVRFGRPCHGHDVR